MKSQVRKFGGKKFKFHKAFKTKSNANIEAEKLRSQGYYVRVLIDIGYDARFAFRVYKRKKRGQ